MADTIFNMPMTEAEAKYANPQRSFTDYIPNVFGAGMPSYIPGLLGEQEAAALQKRANVQGLLGAALSLAQGMSSQGPRRSAAQNILGAIAGGLQAGQGAYQGAVQNYMTQQHIANAQIQQRKAQIDLARQNQAMQAVEEVIASPEVANNPTMVAYFRANPEKAMEVYLNRQMAREARGVAPAAPAQVVTGEVPQVPSGENVMPAVPVVAKASPYQSRIDEAERAAAYYGNIGTKEATDMAGKLRDEANYFRGLQRQEELVGGISESLANVDPTLRRRADAIIANAPSMTQEQLQSRMDAILSDDAKLKEQLDPRFAQQRIAERRAGATVIDMGQRELEKQVAGDVATQISASAQQARSAKKTIGIVSTLLPKVQAGVYEGTLSNAPRAIDQLATALKVGGKDTQEKLARTAEVMQGLAALELQAAEAMKGQGPVTENERNLIARAAGGNLRDFTSAEVAALLVALDKTARFKIESHQSMYQQIEADPTLQKYSKFYKVEMPEPIKGQQPAPTGVTVRRFR